MPDGSHDSSGRARMTVAEAARALGISDSAVRKRVKSGKLEHERTPDGRVYVYLDAATSTSGHNGSRGVGNLKDQVEHLRGELASERVANQKGGRIIARLEERIAELEASQKATVAPEGREAAPPTAAGSAARGQEPPRAPYEPEDYENDAIWAWAQFFITAAASMVAVAVLVISVLEGRVLVSGMAAGLAALSIVAFLVHLWLFRLGKDRIF